MPRRKVVESESEQEEAEEDAEYESEPEEVSTCPPLLHRNPST